MIRTLPLALLLVVMVLIADQATAIARAGRSCLHYSNALGPAEVLKDQRDYPHALALIAPVLARDPNDVRALYLEGIIFYEQANQVDPNHWNPPLPFSAKMQEAFDTLQRAATLLQSFDSVCARQTNAYSLLNTIGALYLNRGYFAQSEKYLLAGYKKKDLLSPQTELKLLDNLGLVYLAQRKYDLSLRYYQEGDAAGSTIAHSQIPIVQAAMRTRQAPVTKY